MKLKFTLYFDIIFYMFVRQPLKGEVSCLIILGLQLEYKVIVVITYWRFVRHLLVISIQFGHFGS